MSDHPTPQPSGIAGHLARAGATFRSMSKAEVIIAIAGTIWLINSFAPWRSRVGAGSLNGWNAGRLARFSILCGLGSLALVIARIEDAAFVRGRPAGTLYFGFGAASLLFAVGTYGSVPALMSAAAGTWTAILLSGIMCAAGNAVRRRDHHDRSVDT